jgi:hypothetical protein
VWKPLVRGRHRWTPQQQHTATQHTAHSLSAVPFPSVPLSLCSPFAPFAPLPSLVQRHTPDTLRSTAEPDPSGPQAA